VVLAEPIDVEVEARVLAPQRARLVERERPERDPRAGADLHAQERQHAIAIERAVEAHDDRRVGAHRRGRVRAREGERRRRERRAHLALEHGAAERAHARGHGDRERRRLRQPRVRSGEREDAGVDPAPRPRDRGGDRRRHPRRHADRGHRHHRLGEPDPHLGLAPHLVLRRDLRRGERRRCLRGARGRGVGDGLAARDRERDRLHGARPRGRRRRRAQARGGLVRGVDRGQRLEAREQRAGVGRRQRSDRRRARADRARAELCGQHAAGRRRVDRHRRALARGRDRVHRRGGGDGRGARRSYRHGRRRPTAAREQRADGPRDDERPTGTATHRPTDTAPGRSVPLLRAVLSGYGAERAGNRVRPRRVDRTCVVVDREGC